MTDIHKKETFELIVDLVRALAWPIVAFALLFALWSPLRQTAELIPSIISRSDTITISGLSLKIGQRLHREATPEVEAVLKAIRKEDIELMLSVGDTSWWDRNGEAGARSRYKKLIQLGLLSEIKQSEFKFLTPEEQRTRSYGVRITPLGDATRDFLRAVVAEFVRELAK